MKYTENQQNLIKHSVCLIDEEKDKGIEIIEFNPERIRFHEKIHSDLLKRWQKLRLEKEFYNEFSQLEYKDGRGNKKGLVFKNILSRQSHYQFLRKHWACEGAGEPISWEDFDEYWNYAHYGISLYLYSRKGKDRIIKKVIPRINL